LVDTRAKIPAFPPASKDKAEALLSIISQSIAVDVEVISPPGVTPTNVAAPAFVTNQVPEVPSMS
jgi:hypothetical protein